jgi:molybdopterin synthase catalytic subunit
VAALTHGAIEPARLIAEASRPDCGAINVFLGTTRNHHEGRAVLRLAYEAYEPMALKALEDLESRAAREFDIETCVVVHRLGDVPIGEASVAVVVASAHRAAAFDASRWAMDELKRTVPIWKKEFFAEGDDAWVRGTKLGG